jgi:lipoyl synthase
MQSHDRFDNQPKVKKLNVLPPNPEEKARGRFPSWLHRKLPKGGNLWTTGAILSEQRLHTVCEEARCPNLFECWSRKTATFLVLGRECTRACGFCDIDFSKTPKPLEPDEPERVAESVAMLGLRHVVITMVSRDDLPDGGASQLAAIMRAVSAKSPTATIEILTSDLEGNLEALDLVLEERPAVFNHNIETVRELTPRVRHKATYDRSLKVLSHAKRRGLQRFTKSGLMVGLGETEEQIKTALGDLKEAGVDIVTMGQYLQPNQNKLIVKAFITPEQFEHYAEYGRSIGIPHMYCGPFVRSSYNADLLLQNNG